MLLRDFTNNSTGMRSIVDYVNVLYAHEDHAEAS